MALSALVVPPGQLLRLPAVRRAGWIPGCCATAGAIPATSEEINKQTDHSDFDMRLALTN